jgi:hypothetical protein
MRNLAKKESNVKMRLPSRLWASTFLVILLCAAPHLAASTGKEAKEGLVKTLQGKDVKALIEMPAYKEGVDLYVNPKEDKRLDDRGIDLKELAKFLKEKGVGVESNAWVTITDVKVDSDRVEIHLGGGGEGRKASKNAEKKGAGAERAGGSRINFRFGHDLTDADIELSAFLPLLSRVLDTTRISDAQALKAVPPEFADAVRARQIVEGMTYQTVLVSAGEPDQKKVDDSTGDSLHETWYYMKDGHRWVVKFLNGKVEKVQIF